MLTGRITKDGGVWLAECEIIGAFTEGRSRKDALNMLADCIETKIDPARLKVRVTEIGWFGPDAYTVMIDANKPAMLAAEVLGYQREMHGLSLAQVAKRLGASSLNAYAAYEQGKREPSLSKFSELLAVVAPEMALTVGPREIMTKKSKTTRSTR